jgi:hypothetical protein
MKLLEATTTIQLTVAMPSIRGAFCVLDGSNDNVLRVGW